LKLSELIETNDWSIRPINMTSTNNLDRAVRKLLEKYDGSSNEEPEDLIGQLEDFQRRLELNDWQNYPWHKAATLMRSLFDSDLITTKTWSHIIKTLLNSLETTDKKSFLKAAFEIYCTHYDKNNKALDRLSNILSSRELEDIPIPTFLKKNFDIFNRQAAHKQLGEYLSKCTAPFDTLKNKGISSPHSKGFYAVTFLSMLKYLQTDLSKAQPEAIDKVKNWLAPNAREFASFGSAAAIDALILSVDNGTNQEARDSLQNFLVENFNDPRVNNSRWRGVSPRAMDIINQWLTTKSLSVFFEIIDRFEESHMWADRRKFWTELNKSKEIDNAWVILSENGAKLAAQIARDRNDPSFRSHGKVGSSRYRVDSDEKCYFIMKIGSLTVIEGTHSFRVRLFKNQNENAPELFRSGSRIYYRDELAIQPNKCDAAFIHDRPGRWMGKTRDYIRRNR
jgi:hypothetical protein